MNEKGYKWRYNRERKISAELKAEIRGLKNTLELTQKAHWRATEAWVKVSDRLETLLLRKTPHE